MGYGLCGLSSKALLLAKPRLMGFVHLQWLNEASVLRISMFIYLAVLGWSPGLHTF